MSTTSALTGRRGGDDSVLLAAVRAGDESAFLQLAATHHAALRRVAMAHGAGAASAEEVVHQTWREVLRRLDSFDGQPSLRSWAAGIASGCARARVLSDQGLEPFASLPKAASEPGRPAVAADRFLPRGHPEIPGHWALVPTPWSALRNGSFPGAARAAMTAAVEELPAAQQLVITLRDVEGWSAREVCDAFDVSESDERVLLHRARSYVRAALERHFGGEGQAGISQQS